MSVDTSNERVERLAADCEAMDREAAEKEEWWKRVAATLRALLRERNEAQQKIQDYAQMAYDAERTAAKANIDAVALAGLDVMDVQPVLAAVQEWAISTGKARDLLRCWIVGTFRPDMLPQQALSLGIAEDDDPADVLRATRAERDALRQQLSEALTTISMEQTRREKAEATIAREDRISDSEMMALLRRRVQHVEAERDAARAEVERLREALRRIAERAWTSPHDYETDRRIRLEQIADRCRAALAGEGKGNG